MRPYQYLARPEGATLSIRRSIQKPTIDETAFTPRTFSGRPAWEGMLVASNNRFDSIPTFLIHVQDGSLWWTFAFSTTFRMSQLPNGPREFLESVKFDSDITNDK